MKRAYYSLGRTWNVIYVSKICLPFSYSSLKELHSSSYHRASLAHLFQMCENGKHTVSCGCKHSLRHQQPELWWVVSSWWQLNRQYMSSTDGRLEEKQWVVLMKRSHFGLSCWGVERYESEEILPVFTWTRDQISKWKIWAFRLFSTLHFKKSG